MNLESLNLLEQEFKRRKIPFLGWEKGRWLLNRIKEVQPRTILELGTANGYSGIILASEGAKLTTVELKPRVAEEARKNFARFGLNIKILVGDGMQILEKLVQENSQFDLIFLDFAKQKYLAVLENCLNLISQNGLIIADNVSFPGCQDFKKAILSHPKLKTEIVQIGDEMSCSVKC